MSVSVWNSENLERLRDLAAARMPAALIGEALGLTALTVWRRCVKDSIDAVRLTPEEERVLRARRDAAERRRNKRRSARRSAQRMAAREAKTPCIVVGPFVSPTSASYRRNMFERAPEMTKSQLRAELAQAVRNTAAMPVE